MDPGGFSPVVQAGQPSSALNLGDEVLGIYMECGCFFLFAERRACCWRVRLSGLPSHSEEASRAAADFQVVSCPLVRTVLWLCMAGLRAPSSIEHRCRTGKLFLQSVRTVPHGGMLSSWLGAEVVGVDFFGPLHTVRQAVP